MLSDRGFEIIEKLIENNNKAVTTKSLAASIGMSERSVKTYLNEVSEYCAENEIELERKPGKGIIVSFTEEQIEKLQRELQNKPISYSRSQRINYIAYILLSGWDSYTYALFSDELYVSRNVIIDDINYLEQELEAFHIRINRLAGHGVSVEGSEFDIRKALRHFCEYPIGKKNITKKYDNRLSIEEENLIINNYSQLNFEHAIETIQYLESEFEILFTDYSFQMLVVYMTIQLFRIRMEKCLCENITLNVDNHCNLMAECVKSHLNNAYNININDFEINYISILLMGAELQNRKVQPDDIVNKMEKEMVDYLSMILNSNLVANELLSESLRSFLPASIVRTRYEIEIRNPFFTEVMELYTGLFTICFTVSKFYEKYANAIPSNHEIAFIALLVGGALHRNPMAVRAVLVASAGFAAGNIVAGKIENRVPDVEIVSILSSEKLEQIENYDCDLILSTIPTKRQDDRILIISPLVSAIDERKIKEKCFELMSGQAVEKREFAKMLDEEHIFFEEKALSRRKILVKGCQKLIDDGYVEKEFLDDVLKREKVETTNIGMGVAIPHGKAEHVKSPKIMLIRLENPIEWGKGNVDLIFILALNFNNINTTKAFFHDFTRLLNSKEVVNRLRRSASANDLELILKNELHWI